MPPKKRKDDDNKIDQKDLKKGRIIKNIASEEEGASSNKCIDIKEQNLVKIREALVGKRQEKDGFHDLVRSQGKRFHREPENRTIIIDSVLAYYLSENNVTELQDFLFRKKKDEAHLQEYQSIMLPVLCRAIIQERIDFADILVKKLVSLLQNKTLVDDVVCYVKKMVVHYLFQNIPSSAKNNQAIEQLMTNNNIKFDVMTKDQITLLNLTANYLRHAKSSKLIGTDLGAEYALRRQDEEKESVSDFSLQGKINQYAALNKDHPVSNAEEQKLAIIQLMSSFLLKALAVSNAQEVDKLIICYKEILQETDDSKVLMNMLVGLIKFTPYSSTKTMEIITFIKKYEVDIFYKTNVDHIKTKILHERIWLKKEVVEAIAAANDISGLELFSTLTPGVLNQWTIDRHLLDLVHKLEKKGLNSGVMEQCDYLFANANTGNYLSILSSCIGQYIQHMSLMINVLIPFDFKALNIIDVFDTHYHHIRQEKSMPSYDRRDADKNYKDLLTILAAILVDVGNEDLIRTIIFCILNARESKLTSAMIHYFSSDECQNNTYLSSIVYRVLKDTSDQELIKKFLTNMNNAFKQDSQPCYLAAMNCVSLDHLNSKFIEEYAISAFHANFTSAHKMEAELLKLNQFYWHLYPQMPLDDKFFESLAKNATHYSLHIKWLSNQERYKGMMSTAVQAVAEADRERFHKDGQNTHSKIIHTGVTSVAKKLLEKFGKLSSKEIDSIEKEVMQFLTSKIFTDANNRLNKAVGELQFTLAAGEKASENGAIAKLIQTVHGLNLKSLINCKQIPSSDNALIWDTASYIAYRYVSLIFNYEYGSHLDNGSQVQLRQLFCYLWKALHEDAISKDIRDAFLESTLHAELSTMMKEYSGVFLGQPISFKQVSRSFIFHMNSEKKIPSDWTGRMVIQYEDAVVYITKVNSTIASELLPLDALKIINQNRARKEQPKTLAEVLTAEGLELFKEQYPLVFLSHDAPTCAAGAFNGLVNVFQIIGHPLISLDTITAAQMPIYIFSFYSECFEQLSADEKNNIVVSLGENNAASAFTAFFNKYKNELYVKMEKYTVADKKFLDTLDAYLEIASNPDDFFEQCISAKEYLTNYQLRRVEATRGVNKFGLFSKGAWPPANTQATGEGIYKILLANLDKRAHVVNPNLGSVNNLFAQDHDVAKKAAIDLALAINGYELADGPIKNGLLHEDATKPIVAVLNTHGAKATHSADYGAVGGVHWVTLVIFPGDPNKNQKPKIHFVDSLNQDRKIPDILIEVLSKGIQYSFTAPADGSNDAIMAERRHHVSAAFPELEFEILSNGAQQAHGRLDCGYWAVDNALQIVAGNDIIKLQDKNDLSYVNNLRAKYANIDNDGENNKNTNERGYETK